jgi:hypothetical protein
VAEWLQAPIEQPWDVVLVDHSPDFQRVFEIRRLAQLAKYLVIHDANGRDEKHYHYSEIFPLFRYRYDFTALEPHTVVLSNFKRLDDFMRRGYPHKIRPWTS